MSSSNDGYQRHQLNVQTQPKSILKKSPSPKFLDSTGNSNTTQSSISEQDKICFNNSSQYINDENQYFHTEETKSLPINGSFDQLMKISNEIDTRITNLNVYDDSSSALTSDEELHQQQQQTKVKIKKNYSRPIAAAAPLVSSSSSSDNNDERKAKRPTGESKQFFVRSNKQQRPNDMQLDEFIQKYQQYGGIHLTNSDDIERKQITTKTSMKTNIDNYYPSLSVKQENFCLNNESTNDDTMNLLKSIDTITKQEITPSAVQLLFDIARTKEFDRLTKIEYIREYVEEQIGISAFLTIYKLIKSSKISIDIEQKPFCHYVNYIPHLCCLIILESEQQKTRLQF